MDQHDVYRERVMLLFAASVLALNYPLLSIADRVFLFLGIPLLYLYIFLVWLAMIVIMAYIAQQAESKEANTRSDDN